MSSKHVFFYQLDIQPGPVAALDMTFPSPGGEYGQRNRATERLSHSPQRCHSVTQFVYDSTEQQCGEEVSQLAGGEVDAGNLEEENHREKKQTRFLK